MVHCINLWAVGDHGLVGEAGDTGKDLVSALGPAEGCWSGVVDVDELTDSALELGGAAVDAAADLFVGQLCKPAFDEIQPGAVGCVKCGWKRGRLTNQLRIRAVLWVP